MAPPAGISTRRWPPPRPRSWRRAPWWRHPVRRHPRARHPRRRPPSRRAPESGVARAAIAVGAAALLGWGGLAAALVVRTAAPPVPPPATAEVLRAAVARLEDGALPPAQALAAARELMARLPAAAADRTLALDPPERRRLLAGFGRAAAPPSPTTATATAPDRALADYLAAWARERGGELARRGHWTPGAVADLAAQQLVDPPRFAADPSFRAWVLGLLPRELDPAVAPGLRDDLLLALEAQPGIDFDAAAAVESGWGAAPRRSADRLSADGREPLRFDDDAEAPIAASVFSLPSSFFGEPETAALLAALRTMAPRRDLVVLADLPLRRRLAACCASPRLHLLETYGQPFTPWVRDPMSLVRRPGGGVVVLVRPNAQPGREADRNLGAELVRRLPPDLDRAWGGIRWEVAPVPFHNGQVLLGRDAAWISVHTLELRTLALLGLDRVPVASFDTAAGIERYFAAARRAAAELAALYGRPVRFVHPLPGESRADGDRGDDRELVERIGGGAGYDLDSLLTLLPARPGGHPPAPAAPPAPVALVASLAAGRTLLTGLPTADWAALRRGYQLAPAGAELAAAVGAAQRTAAAARLDGFLDLVAAHLGSQGWRVARLPLLLVPVTLLADHEGVAAREFQLTWNNVVLETRDGQLRAESFSSLLPAGDREARSE